jgi:hypothetical protein
VYKIGKVHEHGPLFLIRSIGFTFLVVTKVLLARFFTPLPSKKTIFVSWSPLHSSLGRKIGQGSNLVEIKYKLDREQIALYRHVCIRSAWHNARETMKLNPDRERTGYDNFIFCLGFMMEFEMMENLIRNSQHVLMAGQLDRYAIMLSLLAKNENKYFSFVQHGVNTVFEGLYRLHADEVYYLFEISIPFFNTFVIDAEKKKYVPIPSVAPNFKIDAKYKEPIAFASQIIDTDVAILDVMIKHYTKGDILIYPHPTEKNWRIYKPYEKYANVYITRQRISNLKYIVSTGSTLGLEYDLIGVPPVFVNLNKLDSEIFRSDKFKKFDDLASFENWFIDAVAK